MQILDIPKSGRCGDYVFYMRRRRLFRHRYVVPRNVRTAARRRTRGDFGAIAKAWGGRLTEEQRRAWMAAAAKVKSHPRLWQSGPLTGEMHFQGINSARARIGRGMLLWPPERVVFDPNPVEGLTISYVNGRIRLRLRVAKPVTEDIMVFGQAPCSAGRQKWRHGAYLGLLPASQGGECDITDIYVEKYGEPEPGKKVFIRTRQQRDGWEGRGRDCSELVWAKPVAAAEPQAGQIRSPKAETRRKTEIRMPKAVCSGRLAGSPGQLGHQRYSWMECRSRMAHASPSISVSCAMHKGVVPKQHRSISQAIPVQCPGRTGCPGDVRAVGLPRRFGLRAETLRKGHCRELWRGG
jgi:hypothetical protein